MKSLGKSQDQVFFQSEGNQWFDRNQSKLSSSESAAVDIPLRLLSLYPEIRPKNALEVGCSNGWRLEEIRNRYSASCSGIDPSEKAIEVGKQSFPLVEFTRGVASLLPYEDQSFDLVTVHFVLHWISRDTLLKSISEIDRVLKWDGYLVIGDFSPDIPTAVKYHHLPNENVWTYKQDYGSLFLNTQFYQTIAELTYPHHLKSESLTTSSSDDRAKCTLLKKVRNGNYRTEGSGL